MKERYITLNEVYIDGEDGNITSKYTNIIYDKETGFLYPHEENTYIMYRIRQSKNYNGKINGIHGDNLVYFSEDNLIKVTNIEYKLKEDLLYNNVLYKSSSKIQKVTQELYENKKHIILYFSDKRTSIRFRIEDIEYYFTEKEDYL